MKIYTLIALGIVVTLLAFFGLAQVFDIPFLTGPNPWLYQGGWLAALGATGLLVLDVFLPVPSSLIMIANGAAFDVIVGTMLSMTGSLGAALLGYGLGVSGANIIHRFVPEDEHDRARQLLDRQGMLAVIVSRPIPILAETVSIVAGITGMKLPKFIVASVIGTLPIAVIYALAGAAAASFDNGLLVFALVMLAAGIFWLAGHAVRKYLPSLTNLLFKLTN